MLPGNQLTERVFSSRRPIRDWCASLRLGEVKSVGPAGRTFHLDNERLAEPDGAGRHRLQGLRIDSAQSKGPTARWLRARTSNVSVRLMDAFDNPVANSGVLFEAAIESPISLSTATDTNGVATVTLPVITESGHFILDVHTSGTPQVSFSLDMRVEAAAPSET